MTRRTRSICFAASVLASALTVAGCGGGSDSSGSGPLPRGVVSPGGPAPPGSVRADADPVSTFALDIDTASYDYAGRLLREGVLPDPETVRVEEFINAFRQDYPEPAGGGFTVTVDGAAGGLGVPLGYGVDAAYDPIGDDVRLMRVGLQTRSADPEVREPVALTFVIDVSGSMAEPGRLDLAQYALHGLVDQLGVDDSVAIVAYSSRAEALLEMTSGTNRTALHAAIGDLRPLETTNLADGLATGYRVAAQGYRAGVENRVILISDGLANEGATDPNAILEQVRAEAGRGIDLLCVGVGREYGDELMERLADQGDGFAVYVSSPADARDLFVHRLTGTLQVQARDAKAQVTFDPRTVLSYRLVGYDNRLLADADFRDDRVDGAEIGPGHSVTALYEVALAPEATATAPVAEARVRWLDPMSRAPDEVGRRITVADLSGDVWTEPSLRLQVDVVAAQLAGLLRFGTVGWDGYGPGGGTLIDPRELARQADRLAALTADPEVAELAGMVRTAGNLLIE